MNILKTQLYFYQLSTINIIKKKLENYDFKNSCLEHIKLEFDNHISIVDIFYIGKNLPCHKKYILDTNVSDDLNLHKKV